MALPWWNPFATERLVLRTSLNPTECRERLRTLQVDYTTSARGRIESAPDGAIITLTISFNPTIIIILSLSLVVGIGLSLLPLVVRSTQAHSLGTIVALDGTFLAAYIGIYVLGRWLARDDGKYLRSFLRKLLVAHDVA